jgi:hypothetical protein
MLLDYGRVDISLIYRKSKRHSRSSGSSVVTHSMAGVMAMEEDTLGIAVYPKRLAVCDAIQTDTMYHCTGRTDHNEYTAFHFPQSCIAG